MLGTGVLYVAYNLAVYPAVLFTLHRQERRQESVAAALLSRVGIIALVSRGYTVMGCAFIALFALPLLTVGARKVWLAGR